MFFAALFAIVCLIEFFFVAWASEREHPFWATLTILATVVGAWWYGIPVVSWVYGHVPLLAVGFVLYLGLGVVWALYKWWRLVRTVFDALKERLVVWPLPTEEDVLRVVNEIAAEQEKAKVDHRYRASAQFTDENGVILRDKIARNLRQTWKDKVLTLAHHAEDLSNLKYDVDTGKFDFPVREYKGKITTWMAFWPFSSVWTLIDDLVIRLWENLYKMLTGTFRRISESVFRDVNPR
jgi:hypothetical protein